MTTDVFVIASGQDDNLGDSVLRRGLLEALRGPGRTLHVLVGSASEGFVSGLRLDDSDLRYADRDVWLSAITASAAPRLVANAGEVRNHGLTYPGQHFLRATALVRRRGGAVLHTGVGLRAPHPRRLPIRPMPLLRMLDLVSWRDRASQEFARIGAVAPDWAFALGTESARWLPAGDRDRIALTFRFDRPAPSATWCRTIQEIAEASGAELVTYAQVVRDEDPARELAGRVGGRHWVIDHASHAAMEDGVRALLGTCRAVVSDRLHALVIGATEGAAPVGSTEAVPEKLTRSLDPAGLAQQSRQHGAIASARGVLTGGLAELPAAVDAARTELSALRARMDELLD